MSGKTRVSKLGMLSLVLVIVLSMLAACGGTKESGGGEASDGKSGGSEATGSGSETKSGGEKKKINVGFSFASKEGVIYQAFEDYIQTAAKEYAEKNGVEMDFTFTVADADVGKQASNIEDLIGRKPDVIIMMPQDSKAIVSSIKAAHKAGIPVMTYNRAASPDAEEKADAHQKACPMPM